MESDSQASLKSFNAREIFAITLRILERLEKVDQGVTRHGKRPLRDPGEMLQTSTEEVLITLESKKKQLEKALAGLRTLGLELGSEVAQWYAVRRGKYSETMLSAVRRLWEVCVGETGYAGSEEQQCEQMYEALKRPIERRSSIGPHLQANPSPFLHFEGSDLDDSSCSETTLSVDSEENAILTQEDARWDHLCLPALANTYSHNILPYLVSHMSSERTTIKLLIKRLCLPLFSIDLASHVVAN